MGTSALTTGPGIVGSGVLVGIPLWGPIDIHPHLLYTFLDGNGIQAQPGQSSQTVINTIAPGFLLDFGTHWNVDYTPSLSFYSNPVFKNTTDENVLLRGNWTSDEWVLGLSQSYVSTDEPLIETGTQIQQEAYTTALNAAYQMGSKMSLQLGVNQNFRDTTGLTSLEEWTTDDWLNYQAGDMIGAGVGVILGYDNIDPGSSMPFEQLQGRINYHPGPKLTLTLSGGVEDRQFIDPSAPPLISPIFSGELSYSNQLSTITLGATRYVTPSLFANEVEVITSYNGTINQVLSKKFSVQGNVGYSSFPQTSIVPGPLPQYYVGAAPMTTLQEVSHNNVTSLRIGLTYALVQRAVFSVFYTWSDRSSGEADFAYISRQVGFSLNYHY